MMERVAQAGLSEAKESSAFRAASSSTAHVTLPEQS